VALARGAAAVRGCMLRSSLVCTPWPSLTRATACGRRFVCVGHGVGHTEAVGAVALPHKPTSRFVLSASEDRTVKAWDWAGTAAAQSASGDEETHPEPERLPALFTTLAHDKDINSLAVAPNDRLFATGSQDRTAKVRMCADRLHAGPR
jgi:U3 small nucleolar RNA-associated protein 13